MYESQFGRSSGGFAEKSAPAQMAASRSGGRESLADLFGQWFEIIDADTPERLQLAYRVRYQVYCVEQGFEDPKQHPAGLETDEYDANSAHSLLVHRHTGEPVGTVRLILPMAARPDDSFALQRACTDPRLRDSAFLPLLSTGEISRFGLSKNFRRRKTDTFYGAVEVPFEKRPEGGERRGAPPLRLGLMRAIVSMSVKHRLTHWCAMMEPSLLRILTATGIHFEPLGPLVDHHGLRQPCFGNIQAVLSRLRREQPEVWDFVTDDGRYVDRLPGNGIDMPAADCAVS